ncbi:MAG: DUF1566 domain-containing protein [bacterium]
MEKKYVVWLAAVLLLSLSCQGPSSRLTVPDRQAKLVWQAKDGGEMTWHQADQYCRELNLDGMDDWRLPEMQELEAAFQFKSEFTPPVSGSYWSAKISSRSRKAGYVKFDFGVTGYRKTGYPGFVRCVHSQR